MAENQFLSYQEVQAQLQLKFPILNELNGDEITGLESIKLITDTDSYNYEMHDFKRIYVSGCGPKSSPGHPCTHQSHFDQKMLNISNYNRNLIHVIHETGGGKIVYRGLYKIHEITKQLTHAGWAYYQMELYRMEESKPLKRKRYIYDLSDLPKALIYVQKDIQYIIKELRKCETKEFIESLNYDKEAKQLCIMHFSNQFKKLLNSRDYIIMQIEAMEASQRSQSAI